jgi:hypothetical protein
MLAEPRSTSSAFVEGGVAQTVDEDVAGGLQRKAAQADVFLAALGRLEADAGGVAQRVLQGVEVAVVDQPFGHDRHALRHVAQLLVALADARGGGLHGLLAGGLLDDLGAHHGHHGFGCGRRLRERGTGQAEAGGQGAQGYQRGLRKQAHSAGYSMGAMTSTSTGRPFSTWGWKRAARMASSACSSSRA